MTAPAITVRLAGRVDPGETRAASTRPGGPEPGAGALETPGFTPPDRAQLEVTCAEAGIAGLVVGPGSATGPGVLCRPAGAIAVPLPDGSRAVAAAPDGLWALAADTVLAVDTGGRVLAELAVPAVRLVGAMATPGAVWALTSDAACFIAPDRSVVRHPAPWLDPVNAAATGDSLAGWNRDRPDEMVILAPDGTVRQESAPAAREPFERLLAYDGVRSLHASLRSLRRTGPDGGTVDVAGCGWGPAGAFLAARVGDDSWLWTSGPPRRLELTGGERVLAVVDDRVLVASRTRARWIALDGGPGTDPITLDEAGYDREIRPVGWEMPTGFGLAACSPRRLTLASAGPAGLVALAVDWE
jgi:hypothetical protein